MVATRNLKCDECGKPALGVYFTDNTPLCAEHAPTTVGRVPSLAERAVVEWGNRMFPDATPQTIAAHLLREATELYLATILQFEHEGTNPSLASVGSNTADNIAERVFRQVWQAMNKQRDKGEAYEADVLREAGGIALLLVHYLANADLAMTTIGEVMRAEFARIKGETFGNPDGDGVRERV